MKINVTQNGKPLNKSLYTWDNKTKTFSTKENNLVLDFSSIDGVTFTTGDNCMFKTGNYCTFNTGSNCIFNTGNGCTFNTGNGCTFDTGYACTFKTDNYCTFKTDNYCTFDTGYACTFKTGSDCVNIRRDTFEFFEVPTGEEVKTNPRGVKGYVMGGYLYQDGEKKYKAIIADGILKREE